MKIHIITKGQLNENNEYIGSVDLSDFDGAIESVEGLGTVKFRSLSAALYIKFRSGSGIEAGGGIKAGWGIDAGSGIKAGGGIEAGGGIKAGLFIIGKYISSGFRIFAGTCSWKIPEESEMQICGEIRKGTVAYGVHIEKEQAND